jgi:hypothetical protein
VFLGGKPTHFAFFSPFSASDYKREFISIVTLFKIPENGKVMVLLE